MSRTFGKEQHHDTSIWRKLTLDFRIRKLELESLQQYDYIGNSLPKWFKAPMTVRASNKM